MRGGPGPCRQALRVPSMHAKGAQHARGLLGCTRGRTARGVAPVCHLPSNIFTVCPRSFEQLLRRLLKRTKQPAVLVLHHYGGRAWEDVASRA